MQLTHAAEDHHHQYDAGLMPSENFRIDETELTGGEITGQSRQRARQYEGAELIGEDRVTDGAHAAFVGLDAGQRATERRMHDLAHEHIHPDHDNQHEIIELHRIFEIKGLDAGDGELGTYQDINPIRAAAQFSVVKNRINHLREGEGHHDEIDTRAAHYEKANDQGGSRGGEDSEGQGEPEAGGLIFRRDQCERVGGEPEVSGVPKAHQTRVANEEIEAQGEDCHNHDLRSQLNVEGRAY